MKRSDYELVAQAMLIARPVPHMEPDNMRTRQWRKDCESLAVCLAAQTQKFNRELFLTNCGVQQT